MTILLLGESNPYSRDPDDALLPWPENAAGDRLRRILGMKSDEYLKTFTRANLCGERWSMPAAVSAAKSLIIGREPRLIVALGVKVCGAVCRVFDWSAVEAFSCVSLPTVSALRSGDYQRRGFGRVDGDQGVALLHMPHPSGRNRMWRVPGSTQRARDAFANARKGL